MRNRRIIYREDDAFTNKYVANMMLAIGAVFVFVLVMNLCGVFRIDSKLMWIAFAAAMVTTAVAQVLGKVQRFRANPNTKYIMMTLICCATFVTSLLLNFFVTLVLAIPLIIAMNYHSRKLVIMAITGSVISSIAAPLIGCSLKLWNADYLAFLLNCIRPDMVTDVYARKEYYADVATSYRTVFYCVALPLAICVGYFGVAIFTSTARKQERYNQQIREASKTQDQIVQGMADIVENRDSSTGGHVKRTSEVVEILVETIKADSDFKEPMTRKFCEDIVKTAPMHDLGKIAIEDAILTKPGRLTEAEFARIKIHPKKSYDIIGSIMRGVSDTELVKTAQNIALYHHEKYNGTGYPTGKSGKDIPLEARIMAIADVYDALVSKRCYKEAISHDAAYIIIIDSMGSHFDPDLKKYFVIAHPKLTAYYNSLEK